MLIEYSISNLSLYSTPRRPHVYGFDQLSLQLPGWTYWTNVYNTLTHPPQDQAYRRKEGSSNFGYSATRECSWGAGIRYHQPMARQIPVSVYIDRAIPAAGCGDPYENMVVRRYRHELYIRNFDAASRWHQAATEAWSNGQHDRREWPGRRWWRRWRQWCVDGRRWRYSWFLISWVVFKEIPGRKPGRASTPPPTEGSYGSKRRWTAAWTWRYHSTTDLRLLKRLLLHPNWRIPWLVSERGPLYYFLYLTACVWYPLATWKMIGIWYSSVMLLKVMINSKLQPHPCNLREMVSLFPAILDNAEWLQIGQSTIEQSHDDAVITFLALIIFKNSIESLP